MLLKPELLAPCAASSCRRAEAVQGIDAKRGHLYWYIGRVIVVEEQQGADRAAYGTLLVQDLPTRYSRSLAAAFTMAVVLLRAVLPNFPDCVRTTDTIQLRALLSLIALNGKDKRDFYLAESAKNNWLARQLERQVNNQCFERLLLGNDVAAVWLWPARKSR